MTIKELLDQNIFTVVCEGEDLDRTVEHVFCCDLLSIAMSRGIENAAWVTVMGNINTLAVMNLTDMAFIVLAEGVHMDEAGLAKAKDEGYTVLSTDKPVFDAALEIYNLIHA